MIKFKVQQTKEKINNNGGLSLIGCLLKNAGISKLLNKAKTLKISGISEYDVVTSYLRLICMGKTDFKSTCLMTRVIISHPEPLRREGFYLPDIPMKRRRR